MDKDTKLRRILIVDDEERILKFLTLKLKVSGFDVVKASNGQEALEAVRSAHPDVILLDLVMPVMDGFETLHELRRFSKVPIIAFSARASAARKALSLGANDFVAKPFDPDDLLTKIRALLNHTS